MSGLFRDLGGDDIALIGENGEIVSYRDLVARADKIANNIVPRSLAVIFCKNTVDCVAGYVGLMRAGCVLLLVNHTTKLEQLANITARFVPRYIYAPNGQGFYHLNDTGVASQNLHPDLALLLPTSGTTGSRKFVRLSHKNIAVNARSIVDYLGIVPGDRALTTMPMNYTYGLSILHSHLLAGATVVLTEESMVSPKFWQLMKAQRITTFGGVPFIYEMLKKLRFANMDLPDLRYVTQAGGRLHPEMIREYADIAAQKNFKFIVMYGQTEATSRISHLPYENLADKIGSIGKAIPGVRLSLADDAGNKITMPGVAGELLCHGDNVSMGYAENADDLAKHDENNGVLHTGDIAMRDADGFYTIVGRKKRFLKIFGYRVNLDEVETLLRAAGHDCACAGDDDHMKIFVAGNADIATTKTDMQNLVSLNPQGFEIIPVDILPRSESGKVDYGQLRQGSAR